MQPTKPDIYPLQNYPILNIYRVSFFLLSQMIGGQPTLPTIQRNSTVNRISKQKSEITILSHAYMNIHQAMKLRRQYPPSPIVIIASPHSDSPIRELRFDTNLHGKSHVLSHALDFLLEYS